MLFGLLTLITALAISAVAIYYSVAGLVAIFAAAALPIMIMGGTLEVAKLVTAVWLHRYWHMATWWMKTYLSAAVIVLMFITSMGIFGFLSKAHIEQTSASQESVAKVTQIDQEVARLMAVVGRAENRIRQLEGTGTGLDANIQSQIDKEQERIDNAYKRIQPAIDEQNRIIGSQAKLFQDELARVDEQLATLQRYIDAGDRESIKKAQAMIGARQDGSWGRNTAAAAEEWRKGRQQARADLLTKIEQATNNPQARAAANEIKRLRQTVERDIAESNKLINRLRSQIGKVDNSTNIQKELDEQNERIRTASSEIDKLTEEKFQLQAEYRKLEAEVGPIKYIAEFIYGESADNNMLEEAVRWVIVIIIFVFDPLAVLLLLAAQYTFDYHRRNKDDNGGWLRQWQEYEQKRAQAIVDNPGFTPSTSVPENAPVVQENDNEPVQDTVSQEPEPVVEAVDEKHAEEEKEIEELSEEEKQELARIYSEVEKKDTESSAVSRLTEEELDALEDLPEWQLAKQKWKDENPKMTLKFYKNLYLEGKIDRLPWEDYVNDKTYIVKEGTEQVTKTRDTGYIQNEEQSDSSLWKNINKQK